MSAQVFSHAFALLALRNVRPSPKTNRIFSLWVNAVLSNPLLHKKIVLRQVAKQLRRRCAKGEYEMELEYAKRIIGAKNPHEALAQFPYVQNYEQLIGREKAMVERQGKKMQNVLFLGSGPLPLSGIYLAQKSNCRVTLVERDDRAREISEKLINILGYSSQIEVRSGDAATYDACTGKDLIYIAALAGECTKEEEQILRNVARKKDREALVLLRSAEGSRTLLYRQREKEGDKYMTRIAEMHPHDNVVNCAILYK